MSSFSILKVLVNTGSNVGIIYNHAFDRITDKNAHKRLRPYHHDIYDFNNQPMKVSGVIILLMRLGDNEHKVTRNVEFLTVDYWSPYNMILG